MTQIALLKKYGLPVRGIIGQHLLIDPNIQRKIVETVSPRPKEWILEIGPGLGALTAQILACGPYVIAVEKDSRFCEILLGELGEDYKKRLWIENTDILSADLGKLMRKVMASSLPSEGTVKGIPISPDADVAIGVRASAQVPAASDQKVKVVSNLPYYITSPVLFWLISNRRLVEHAVLMMQKEVADRLLAQPGDKDYGRLTLAVRYYAEVSRQFDVSRSCFTPKPDVDSSVITLDFHPPSKQPKGIDENFLFHIIQVAFGERRKILLGRLAKDPQIGKSREEILNIFHQLGITEKARGEDLLLKDFMALCSAFQKS